MADKFPRSRIWRFFYERDLLNKEVFGGEGTDILYFPEENKVYLQTVKYLQKKGIEFDDESETVQGLRLIVKYNELDSYLHFLEKRDIVDYSQQGQILRQRACGLMH